MTKKPTKKTPNKTTKKRTNKVTSGQLKPRKTQVKLTLKKRIEVYQYLVGVCKSIKDTNFWKYTKDNSDHTVAEKFTVPLSSVRAIRGEMMGELRDRPTRGATASTQEIQLLKAKIVLMERELTIVNTKLNLLAGSIEVKDWKGICHSAESIVQNSESALTH